MSLKSIAFKFRKPSQEVGSLFYTRWSPRAMSGKLTKKDLMGLFEAARWAPSAFNGQPWRFVIGMGKDKEKFMSFLVDFNKEWCKNASALVVVLSRVKSEYKETENKTHSFDTGAAWMGLALEGARRGYVVHGMSGFDYDLVRKELKISSAYKIEAMCAIGKFGGSLSPELAKMEVPSQRKKLSEIVSFGKFSWK